MIALSWDYIHVDLSFFDKKNKPAQGSLILFST